jgi:hypothetical protein
MSDHENNSSFEPDYIFWGVVICLFGLFALVATPNFIHEPSTSPANACINNMRQIDATINEWALVNGKTNGTPVTENDIKPYIKLKSDGTIWRCPEGGKYTYGKVGDVPQISCSLSTATPAHKLPY